MSVKSLQLIEALIVLADPLSSQEASSWLDSEIFMCESYERSIEQTYKGTYEQSYQQNYE